MNHHTIRKTTPGTRAGFSLTEVLISISILAVGVLGMSRVIFGSSHWQGRVETQLEMAGLGDAKLDDLRSYAVELTSDTVQLSMGGSLTSDVADHSDVVQSAEGRPYRRRWEVTPGPAGSRHVEVRIVSDDPRASEAGGRDFETLFMMGTAPCNGTGSQNGDSAGDQDGGDQEEDVENEDDGDHEDDADNEDDEDHEDDVDNEDDEDHEDDVDNEDDEDHEDDVDNEDDEDHEDDVDNEDDEDHEDEADNEDGEDGGSNSDSNGGGNQGQGTCQGGGLVL